MNFYIGIVEESDFLVSLSTPKRFLHRKKNNKAKPKKNRKILFGTDRNEMVCVFGYKGERATSPKNTYQAFSLKYLQKKKTKTSLQFIALFCLAKLDL